MGQDFRESHYRKPWHFCGFTSVIVNFFMCELIGLRGSQIKHYFWVHLWGCSQMKLAFESVNSGKPVALLMWVGIIQSHWGRGQNKKMEEVRTHPFYFLPACLSWDISCFLSLNWGLHHQLFWVSGFPPWSRLYYWLSCVSSLHMADHGTFQPP